MKITRPSLLLLFGSIMLSGLAACSQSSNDVASTDAATAANIASTATPVNIYPASFFEPGYTESYIITGSDQVARIYSGTFELVTSEQTLFNGEAAVPVTSTLSYTRPINGVTVPPITFVLTEYYSVATPRKYLGSVNNDTSVIMVPVASATDLPEVVDDEGSGIIGDFTGTDSTLESIAWSLNKLDDNTYQLTYFSQLSDSAGDIIGSEAETYGIDSTGERHTWALDTVLPGQGMAFSFAGTRL
ncbi:MAG: hypothetical protein RQ982_05620 [Gammaproteobacteria bacterium]|nr:hypothetical protein [Gammaproteobacteria bacterium]